MPSTELRNYIGGAWTAASGAGSLPVVNPATGETIASVPLSPASEVDRAVSAAAEAFPAWRRTPPGDRIQYLFKLKQLLEDDLEELARTVTRECGKTREESIGELRRGIENVEVACGIPSLLQGYVSEDIASGIDETMIRQPLGVVAIVTPFNFPGMIPLWFLPYAIACGNTAVVKPSEKVPMTMTRVFSLLEKTGLPRGVANLVNGARETVDALLDHPAVRAVSFVGSTPVARHVYSRAVGNGLEPGVQMGPVISPQSKSRIEGLIDVGAREGAKVLVDGRGARIPGGEKGTFLRPTILDGVDPRSSLARTEIFGPVLSLVHVPDVEAAIALVNSSSFGNQACLFTRSGAAARKFRYEAQVGNIGINVGVAAPIAYFPFSGWKDSFFGDLHGQGRDSVDFYTEKKVIVERWPKEWSRVF